MSDNKIRINPDSIKYYVTAYIQYFFGTIPARFEIQ